MTKVAIFGSGPAGLLAAHAASNAKCEIVDIFSFGNKSKLFGAQYLHRAIPGIPLPDPRPIKVRLNGTAEGYRDKVYGDAYAGPVSPSALENGHLAWDIRAAYDWLWEVYESKINVAPITRYDVDNIHTVSSKLYDFVFAALPLRRFCRSGHTWAAQKIYAVGDAPELGLMCPVPCPDETLCYDGTKQIGWYRSARVFGYTTCEWPAGPGRRPPLANIAEVIKPLSTNCDCWPNFIRLGRYGKWQKGELSHHAFEQVTKILGGEGAQSALW